MPNDNPDAEQAQRERWSRADQAKNELVQKILSSPAHKKIVVAGPGTGKTSLFKEILEKGYKNPLTLTFINSLVEDLSLELWGLSEVKTLHSFARQQLSKAKKTSVLVHPFLSTLIREDMKMLTGEDVDFDSIFQTMDETSPHIAFYKKRKDWYAHYGFDDLIYAAVKYFEQKESRIPEYDIVLVDEYQDFNALEVMLIELLAKKSPILLVGDDDQALYDLKGASTIHIRDRFTGVVPGYASFTLHHCRRCTRVIIDAANDILSEAVRLDLLKGRVKKQFVYLERKKKDKDCEKYSHITHLKGQSGQIAFLIGKEIEKIAEDKRDAFQVLVVCPKSHCAKLAQRFRNQGFSNIIFDDDESDEKALANVIDGLKKIADAKKGICNLGWRIVCKHLLKEHEFAELIAVIGQEPQNNFQDNLAPALKKKIKKLVSTYKKIRGPKILNKRKPPKGETKADLIKFFEALEIDPLEIARAQIKKQALANTHQFPTSGVHKIQIRISTITKSKGLSYDYVLVAHFSDRYYLERDGHLSDKKVCSFLVALTRARQKAYLVSYTGEEPTFLKWIAPERIETIEATF